MDIKKREYRLPETLQKLMKASLPENHQTQELAAYSVFVSSRFRSISRLTMLTPDKVLLRADYFGVARTSYRIRGRQSVFFDDGRTEAQNV